MKHKWLILYGWFIVFNFACHHQVQNEIVPVSRHLIADTVCYYFYQDQASGIKKQGEQIPFILLDPLQLQGAVILKNGHIFMIDPTNPGYMDIYNIKTGKMDYIETKNPKYFTTDDATRFADALSQHLPLSFYHFYTGRYYQYTLENDKVKLTRQNLQPSRTMITKAEQLSENNFVTLGYFRTGLLGLCDKESKEMKYFGHYPISVDLPFERTAMEQIVQSFQGNIAYSNQHSKVVYGSSGFAYLSCYRFTGKDLKLQWEKHIVPPPATQIVDGFLESDYNVTQGGFSDVAISGDHIFAAYTQRNVTDSLSDVTHSILVYDMTGNHVATFLIDDPISSILIDAEERVIYGMSRSEGERLPVIVRFQFSRL